MALIKCPECGKAISDKDKVCGNCGFPLQSLENKERQMQERVVGVSPGNAKNNMITTVNKKAHKGPKRRIRLLIACGIVLIFALIILSIFAIKHGTKGNDSNIIDMGAIGNKITIDGTIAYVAGTNTVLVPYDFSGDFSSCTSEASSKNLRGCGNPRLPADETDDLPEEVVREIISFYGDIGGFWTSLRANHATIEIAGQEPVSRHYAGIMTNYFSVGKDGVAKDVWGYYLDGTDDSKTMGLLVLYDVAPEFEFVDIEDTANPIYSTDPNYDSIFAEESDSQQEQSSSSYTENPSANLNEPLNEPSSDTQNETPTSNPSDCSSQENIPLKVGDEVWLDERLWTVLDIQDGKALILYGGSILTNEEWYNEGGIPVTWETCTLRQYLNGEFLNSFAIPEKEKILKTTLINDDNPDWGTEGGNNTEDKIFLLSIAEAEKYKNVIPSDNSNPWSWLRSPGGKSNYAAALYASDGRIEVDTGGFLVSCPSDGIVKFRTPGYGYYPRIRPACWIKLD